MVTIAASLAKKYIMEGWAVGLLTGGKTKQVIAPAGGEEHLHRILSALATIQADGNTPVFKLLSAEVQILEAPGAIAIVSHDYRHLDLPLGRLTGSGNSVAVILLEDETTGAPGANPAVLNRLAATGAQVYAVRAGDDLSSTLGKRPYPGAGRSSSAKEVLR